MANKNQTNLFDFNLFDEPPKVNWELPDLRGKVKKLSLDTEGELNIWRGGKPCGISIATEDFSSWYIPFGHNDGFNFEIEQVRNWAKDNLFKLDLYFLNAKHDFNTLLSVGIDLESNNNRLHDVMHCPALLLTSRQDYDLDSLVKEELGRNKAICWGGNDYEKFPMKARNSAHVAAYAMQDAIDTIELSSVYAPQIAQEGLEHVLALEDSLLYAVAAMERKGALIDVERLSAWKKQIHNRYIQIILEIYKLTGLRVEPTKATDLAKLFSVLKIDYSLTPTGLPSFTDEFLQKNSNHPVVKLANEGRQLKSLESKAINKFEKSVDNNGIIRYVLNQLKAVNDEGSNGAVTGRFSSSGGGKYINGINVQQIINDEKQEKIPIIADFPIRDLIIPEEGKKFLSADAKQIEYRFFAHYQSVALGNNKFVKAYEINPLMDYHDYVNEKYLKELNLIRKIVKNVNFSKIYGTGVETLNERYLHLELSEAKYISENYDREFPEARQLLNYAADLARSRDTGDSENRGWVRTIFGRKRQFTNRDLKFNKKTGKTGIPYYAALNYVIQGSAADLMKIKLLNLYNSRYETGFDMRFTVHDEVCGDIENIEGAKKVQQILDSSVFEKLTVPILWDVAIGKSWANCEKLEKLIA